MDIQDGKVASERVYTRPDELVLTFKVPKPYCYLKHFMNYGIETPQMYNAWINPYTSTFVGRSLTFPTYYPEACPPPSWD